jgi:predicted metal-binding membrane protein
VAAPPTRVETALADQRPTLIIVLIVVPLACWLWVAAMARDMYGPMTGASAWMMTVTWDAPRLLLLWAMWAAMMAGMMLPSAAPMLLLYARTMRNRTSEAHPARLIYAMAGGYLAVWIGFSLAATALQRLLAELSLLNTMMEATTPLLAAGILAIAGLYQLTPLKRACLQACRSPFHFLTARWRDGVAGAVRMGIGHGSYCLGCCWALMLILFAGGVMNLAVILGLTVWVAMEKLLPFGDGAARATSIVLLAYAVWIYFA